MSFLHRRLCQEELTPAPCPALSKPLHLAKAANRLLQRLRPNDLADLDFDIEEDHLPSGFLQADVHVKSRRHIVFTTKQQLEQLAKAKTCYVEGRFKLVRKPFTQLLSINTFVRAEECSEQVPLAFVVMSEKKKNDYITSCSVHN